MVILRPNVCSGVSNPMSWESDSLIIIDRAESVRLRHIARSNSDGDVPPLASEQTRPSEIVEYEGPDVGM